MTYGICNLTAIAMRKEARHASEMVSQLLYNETYTVLDTTKEWLLIQTEDKPSAIQQDHESGIEDSGSYPYQGWIQAKQFCEISEEEFNAMKGKTPYLINKPVANYNGLLLTMGTPLYEPHPDAVLMPSEFHPDLMVDYAKQLLGAPYLWGGRMSMGLDCSGLTKVCALYFLQETQTGDLAFFGDEDGVITHVGILMDNEQIIHCSGQVRIDYMDQTGIFNKEKNEHTHRLQVIKRPK